MKYLEAYKFPFRSPRWAQNLGWCLLVGFIPIAGDMIIFGYQFDIIEALHLRGKEGYPPFDSNRFLKYLVRGAWPFLVQLIAGLPVGLVSLVLIMVPYFGLIISITPAGNHAWAPVWKALFGCSFLLMLVFQALAHIVIIPMALRAGLMQDFAAGFSWAFIRDFTRRLWWPTFLAELFLVFTGLLLGIVGLLLCFLPVLVVAALVRLAQAYLFWELYEEYLRRGGMEVALQVQPARPEVPYFDEEN